MGNPGSGLSGQFMCGQETTVGTPVTADHSYEVEDVPISLNPKWVDGEGMHAGGQFKRAARSAIITRDATGSVKQDFTTKKQGLLVRHALGSATATPTVISGAAYKQVHQVGNAGGLGLTCQVGVPQIDGTVKPFTYPGCKVADWEFSSAQEDLLKFALSLDAMDELVTSPALAAFSPPVPSELFNHTQCVIKLGGTASTATGVVSIAGGTPLATLVRSLSVKGTTPLANRRFGTSATKKEQIQNGYSAGIVTLDAEFATQAEIYDVYRAQTTVPLQITFTGTQIGVTGSFNSIDFVFAATKIKKSDPSLNGVDLSNQPVELEVFDDAANNPLQITIISTDTTL